MLVLSRRQAESVWISLAETVDPNMTVAELFERGPIEVTVLASSNNRVKLGVSASPLLAIWRGGASDKPDE